MWVRIPPPAQMRKLVTRDIQWSPELAYFVGLLVTDGCLSKDGRHITLRSSDLQLIETVKISLGLKTKIGSDAPNGKNWMRKASYRIQIGDAALYRWLETIGLFPAKTYTIGEITVPGELFRDFVRGHLDGDGTVRTYQDSYNKYRDREYTAFRLYISLISASKKHLVWLRKRILEQTKCSGALIKESIKPGAHQVWRIKYSKRESVDLLRWIYYQEELPCLERKRQIAQEALRIIKASKRKVYTLIQI